MFILAGCSSGCSGTTPADDAGTEGSDRGTIGKGDLFEDLYGSCEGVCGEVNSSGNCACDELCASYEDCCDDYLSLCVQEPCDCTDPNAPDHCLCAEECSSLVYANGGNPCSNQSFCKTASSAETDGVCHPVQALYDIVMGEYETSFGDDTELWPTQATGKAYAVFVTDSGGAFSVDYHLDLSMASRNLRFYFDTTGLRTTGILGAVFRLLPDKRMLQVGSPTIFVSAPQGETLETFLAELQSEHAEHVAYPLNTIDHGDSLLVLAARPLYEVGAFEELQARFADHEFGYNATHLQTTGSTISTEIADLE